MLPVAYYSVWPWISKGSAQKCTRIRYGKLWCVNPWTWMISYIYKSDLHIWWKWIHLNYFRFEIIVICISIHLIDMINIHLQYSWMYNFIHARLQEIVAAGWLLYLPTQQILFCPSNKDCCMCSTFRLRHIQIFKYHSHEIFTIKDEMVHLKGIWALVVYSRYADIRLKEYFTQKDHFLSLTVEDLW